MIPDYQILVRQVLKCAAGGEVRIGEVMDRLARDLRLSPEERAKMLPSDKQTMFANRLVASNRGDYFGITEDVCISLFPRFRRPSS